MRLTVAAFALLLFVVGCQSGSPVELSSRSPAASPSPTTGNATVSWSFTQSKDPTLQHPDVKLSDGLKTATTEVDAAIYAINRPEDVTALIEAQQRCSCVRIISDAVQSKGPTQIPALTQLHQAGIPIKIDSHTGIMHLKVAEIDRRVVYEGSFNWTNSASSVNDEILVKVESVQMATSFANLFDNMWNDTRRFKDWAPSAPAAPAPQNF